MNSIGQSKPLQYLYVTVGILIIVTLKLEAPAFQHGLSSTLLIALVACTAILGSLDACILAIILSALAQNYLRLPHGFSHSWAALSQTLQFVVASIIICWLARRERKLLSDNRTLLANAQELKKIMGKMERDMKGKSKEAAKLKQLNGKLDNLVAQFMNDQADWDTRWKNKQP